MKENLPSDFCHLFINSPIDALLYRRVLKAIPSKKSSCCVLTLVTYGGSPHDAYRIGRYLQTLFEELYIHVPAVCASAGTLLVCAGSGLIISPISELGPLDAQLLKSDEIRTRRSGLVTRSLFENLGSHAFELHTGLVEKIISHSDGTIKYRTAAHVAGEMVVGLMHGLYEQMNPEQIGEDYRFLKVAEEYGKRLAEQYQNISDENLRALVYDFPSHDFIIDFREAVRIFENVDLPSTALYDAISDETKTPLSPLASKERIVTGELISACPIYDKNAQRDDDDGPVNESESSPETDRPASGGSPKIGGNGTNSEEWNTAGQSVSSGARKGRGKKTSSEDQATNETEAVR